MVLAAGRLNVEQLMAGNVAGLPFSHIGVGTSNAAVTDTDSALAGVVMKPITAVNYYSATNEVQFEASLAAGDPAMLIQEVGLFNSTGTLCYRKLVTPVNKISGTSYAISYKIKVQ